MNVGGEHVGRIDLVTRRRLATSLIDRRRIEWCRVAAEEFGEVVFEGGLIDDQADQRIEHPDDTRRCGREEHGAQRVEATLRSGALQQLRVHQRTPLGDTGIPVGVELGVAEPVEDLLDLRHRQHATLGVDEHPFVDDADVRIAEVVGPLVPGVSTIGVSQRLPAIDHDLELVEPQRLSP